MYDSGEISLSREPIYRPAWTSVDDIIATVRRWGIIVFPEFVPAKSLAALNAEFDAMMAQRASLGFVRDEYDNLANIRVVRARLDRTAFPATSTFFSDPMMTAVADAYYGPGLYRLNYEIFVSNLAETQGPQHAPPFALHFDRKNLLKFFIYLTDTDESNGAMRASPGSNGRNRVARLESLKTTNVRDVENVVPEPATPSMPITGPAGTMFVFDTDVCHGASVVGSGRTRRTMRGHTEFVDAA